MCFTLGVTILDSRKEIHVMLSSYYTDRAPVCISKASMQIWTALVFLTYLYMQKIYP